MSDDAKFTHGSLMRHVTVMSFTASIGLMAIFAVDFVDMIFISMLGNAALAAAVGYAGTILFFTTSVAIGLSIAAAALVARAVGAKKPEEAAQYATSVAMYGMIVTIGVVILVFTLLSPTLSFLGASGETKELATSYLTIILPSLPVLMLGMVGSGVLRAHGDATRAMTVTLTGGVVNAIFDPILIFWVGLGLDGAAYASVLARIAIAGAALYPAITKYNGFARPQMAFFSRDASAVFAIAGPAVLANIATPVGNGIVTREIAKFGTDAVAGFAIVGRLTPVAFAVLFALSGAIGPIIGQNLGAGLNERVRGTFYAGMRFIAIYVLAAAAILFLARPYIAAIFGATGETLALIYLFCGPLALLGFFNGVIFIGNAAFNNLGHPYYATWVNWGRHTIGTWPFAIAGGAFMGAGGVLIGQAIGGIIFAAIAVWLSLRIMETPDVEETDHALLKQKRLHTVMSRRH